MCLGRVHLFRSACLGSGRGLGCCLLSCNSARQHGVELRALSRVSIRERGAVGECDREDCGSFAVGARRGDRRGM